MCVERRAFELAESGSYKDADAVVWALFKEGYGNAGRKLGFFARRRLARACAAAKDGERKRG